MRLFVLGFLLLLLLPQPGRTVILRDGKVHEGPVAREGAEVLISTSKGPVRVPAASVMADFVSLGEARRACEARFEQAKKLLEESGAKADSDPLKRRLILVAYDIAIETRDLIEILEKRSPLADREALQGVKGRLFQFLRLVRDAKGSTGVAGDIEEVPFVKTELEALALAIEGSGDAAGGLEIRDELGPGQGAFLKDLASDNATTRATAAAKLASPPAPHAIAALAKALRTEKDRNALVAITAALMPLDLGPRLKIDFAWAPEDDDATRRLAVLGLARRQAPDPACDFLGDCLRAKPPADPRLKAAFASAFRKLRPRSVDELRETLLKSKDRDVQLEAVRQLGMMRDRATLPALKIAMNGGRDMMTVAFNALEKTGGPAVPLVMEMLGDGSDEVRRLARILAQRITREEMTGVSQLQKWYAQYKRHIDDDEQTFWKGQEENDFPVGPDEFKIFDRKLPGPKDP